ncbi:PLD nuclease N-terminal domain-containing protein [Salinibacterium sp. TMP30]|uniref:PLD nuclease N-terminal domain-containing protein n=1 Tax=Salinibacterium sp. TMP30 TaxID=3138237 RepID=UPI00313A41CE
MTITFAIFAMMVFVLVDLALIPESRIQNLGRVKWILVVIFLPLLGSIFWLTMGREYGRPVAATSSDSPHSGETLVTSDTSETPAEPSQLAAEAEYFQKQEMIRELERKLRERKQLP